MVLAAYGYVEERGSGSQSTSRPWRVTSSEWSGHGWTRCWSHRLPWPPLPPLHEATGAVASPLMPTRTGYGAPQLPHRPQHKPRPEQNQSLTPNRPHAAEPTRKALVTRESRFYVPDLDAGLDFYRDHLGHRLLWRTDREADLEMPDTDAEIVLSGRAQGPRDRPEG